MVTTCSAIGCTERANKGSHTTFHKFPLNPEIRGKWIKAIRRRNYHPTKNARICEKHFKPDCYIEVKSGRKILKPEAVPELFDFYSYVKGPRKRTSKVMDKEFANKIMNEYRDSMFTYSSKGKDDIEDTDVTSEFIVPEDYHDMSLNEDDHAMSSDKDDEEEVIYESIIKNREVMTLNDEDFDMASSASDKIKTEVDDTSVLITDLKSESEDDGSADERSSQASGSDNKIEFDRSECLDIIKSIRRKCTSRLRRLEAANAYLTNKKNNLDKLISRVNSGRPEGADDGLRLIDCFIEEEQIDDFVEKDSLKGISSLCRIDKENLDIPAQYESNEFMLYGVYVSFFLNSMNRQDAERVQKDISALLRKYATNKDHRVLDNITALSKYEFADS